MNKPTLNELQYFEYNYGDTTYIFQTCINGEGYYSRDNNTILGGIFTMEGKRVCTSRIDYALLKPLNYSRVVRIVNDIELQQLTACKP